MIIVRPFLILPRIYSKIELGSLALNILCMSVVIFALWTALDKILLPDGIDGWQSSDVAIDAETLRRDR